MTFLTGSALLLGLIVAVVLIAGTGDSGEEEAVVAEAGEKPSIQPPESPPPRQLEVEDLEVGDGPAAEVGDTLRVHYVGVLYGNGEEFDSSYEGGEPFELQLTPQSIIPGWVQGLEGMQVGGRRQLIIPPDLAYGEEGSPPAVPGNATLIFVVDLLGVE